MTNLKIAYEDLAKSNRLFMNEIQKAVQTTIDKGWYILGSEVKNFEQEFASYLGAPHCAGLASGLDALIIALKVLDLPKGSEVIVPSNTYVATILSIIQEGHVPVLVEPDIRTYNINPKKIEAAITSKTKALMIVHLYGKACEMNPILEITKRRGLHLIEDCAQSHGARYQNRQTGTFGLGAFSFYPTKNLGCMGDGGALTTSSAELDEKTRTIRNYGSKVKYYNEVIGMNSRLDELQAALLRVKLRYLDQINEHKRALAEVYFEELSSIQGLTLPVISEGFYDIYHIFNVRTEKSGQRDALKKHLLENGIGTDIHYPVAPHLQEALKTRFNGQRFPISEEIHATTLSLPISFGHTKEEMKEVAKAIRKFYA